MVPCNLIFKKRKWSTFIVGMGWKNHVSLPWAKLTWRWKNHASLAKWCSFRGIHRHAEHESGTNGVAFVFAIHFCGWLLSTQAEISRAPRIPRAGLGGSRAPFRTGDLGSSGPCTEKTWHVRCWSISQWISYLTCTDKLCVIIFRWRKAPIPRKTMNTLHPVLVTSSFSQAPTHRPSDPALSWPPSDEAPLAVPRAKRTAPGSEPRPAKASVAMR